jgi:hypothetical protein
MNDTDRLNYLEQLLWSAHCGNGIALIPTIKHDTGECFIEVSDVGYEDGIRFSSEMSHDQHTLRAVLDDLAAKYPIPGKE